MFRSRKGGACCLGWGSGVGPGQLLPVLSPGRLLGVTEDLGSVAACTGLGGAWERLCGEPRPAATGVGLGAASREVQGAPRPAAVSSGFVDLSRGFTAVHSVGRSHRLFISAPEKGPSLCPSWVAWVLGESPGWGEFRGDSHLAPCAWQLSLGRAQQRNKMAEKAARPTLPGSQKVPF